MWAAFLSKEGSRLFTRIWTKRIPYGLSLRCRKVHQEDYEGPNHAAEGDDEWYGYGWGRIKGTEVVPDERIKGTEAVTTDNSCCIQV